MCENVDVKKPRKKKGSKNIPREAPFPIPIESLTGKPASEKRWYRYFAKLKDDKVIVDRLGDMTFLYKMGFFGKGCLSNGDPQFNKFGNTFDNRQKTNKQGPSDIIHHERVKQHLSWSDSQAEIDRLLNQTSPQNKQETIQEDSPMLSVSDQILSSDETDEIESKRCKLEDPEDPVVTEFLQLALEEAFFLVFGLGCLTISDDNEERITIPELWKTFCKLKPRFVETYTVYHYFRSKGWVVRDGLIYGSDFLLYKEGMPFYHSSYAVFSYMVENDEIRKDEDSLPWDWKYLSCINRVAEHVAKEVLLCFVVKQEGFTDDELSSPRCLMKMQVQEMILRRWIPEKHRESKKESKFK